MVNYYYFLYTKPITLILYRPIKFLRLIVRVPILISYFSLGYNSMDFILREKLIFSYDLDPLIQKKHRKNFGTWHLKHPNTVGITIKR